MQWAAKIAIVRPTETRLRFSSPSSRRSPILHIFRDPHLESSEPRGGRRHAKMGTSRTQEMGCKYEMSFLTRLRNKGRFSRRIITFSTIHDNMEGDTYGRREGQTASQGANMLIRRIKGNGDEKGRSPKRDEAMAMSRSITLWSLKAHFLLAQDAYLNWSHLCHRSLQLILTIIFFHI